LTDSRLATIVVWVHMNALGLYELRSIPTLLPTFQSSTRSFPRKERPQNTPTPQAATAQTMQICFPFSLPSTTRCGPVWFIL